MKHMLLVVLAFALILGSVAIAAEPPNTVVGPVMENRYKAPDPRDVGVEPPETVEKLMDQGVIPAAEQQRLNKQVIQVPAKKK